MEYDKDKVDDMVLALMYLGMFSDSLCATSMEEFRLGCLG